VRVSTSSTQTAPIKKFVALLDTNRKQDVFIAASLFVLSVLTRLPLIGEILYHWDAINFAKALERFDVWAGQPHVPGYILYVGVTKLVHLLLPDAQATLVAVSMVASALAIVFLYFLGRDIFNRTIGWMAALFLAASPLFWFYGVIALPHTLDAFVVIILVWLFYRILQGETHLVIPAAIGLGIAGGLRPQTQIFLLPLAVFAVWRTGLRRAFYAGLTLALVNLAWFIPLIWSTGGIRMYFYILGKYSANFNDTTSVFSAGILGFSRNIRKLVMYSMYGWSLFAIPSFIGGALFAWQEIIKPREHGLVERLASTLRGLNTPRFWFFVLWMAPSLAYYAFIHMGQQGLVFVFLPALLLFSAVAVDHFNRRRQSLVQLLVASFLIINGAIFLVAPTYPLGVDRFKLLTLDTIREHDKYYLARFEGVQNNFSPAHTLLITYEWVFSDYYLHYFPHIYYEIGARWEVGDGLPAIRQGETVNAAGQGLRPDVDGYLYLVILDDDLLPYNLSKSREESIALTDGTQLHYVRFKPSEWVYLGPESFGLVPQHMLVPLEEFSWDG
jgi:hypothetical protein